MNIDDPFDPNNFTISEREVTDTVIYQKKVKKAEKLKVAFAAIPYEAGMQIAGATKNAMLAVIVELEYQRFRTNQDTVKLPNTAFTKVGISHDAKSNALSKLIKLGWITVDQQGKKSPLVTLRGPRVIR